MALNARLRVGAPDCATGFRRSNIKRPASGPFESDRTPHCAEWSAGGLAVYFDAAGAGADAAASAAGAVTTAAGAAIGATTGAGWLAGAVEAVIGNKGTINKATMLMILIKGLIAGPAVSL